MKGWDHDIKLGLDCGGQVPRPGLVPQVGKIGVLRANGLGDLVFSLPALEALRAAYPQAEIVLLGLAWQADFLRRRPTPIDRVVTLPFGTALPGQPGWQAGSREEALFFTNMRAEAFDLALQLHGGGRNSNPLVASLGARVTAGLRAPDACALDRWIPYVYFQSEILRFSEVVALVGARPSCLEPHLAATESDLEESFRVVSETEVPVAVLHPGAGDPRRRWPAESFAAVGRALAAAGAQVVVVGSGGDQECTGPLLANMPDPVLDTTDRLSLGGLLGLLSRADLVVANDSGPLHLAEAAGTPTVGIYWCANLINADPLTRTRHRPCLSWRLECPICGVNTITGRCPHTASFVADIPIAEVIDQALELLLPEEAGPRGKFLRRGWRGQAD